MNIQDENSPNPDSRGEPLNRTERRHFSGFARAETQSRQNAGARAPEKAMG
jgi:hypothetical protein